MQEPCKEMPEPIRLGMARFSDEEFWKPENLVWRLKNCPNFSWIMQRGLSPLTNPLMDQCEKIDWGRVGELEGSIVFSRDPEKAAQAVLDLRTLITQGLGLEKPVSVEAVLTAALETETRMCRKDGKKLEDSLQDTALFVLDYDEPLAWKIMSSFHDLRLVQEGTDLLKAALTAR